jgi:hypothetical protein
MSAPSCSESATNPALGEELPSLQAQTGSARGAPSLNFKVAMPTPKTMSNGVDPKYEYCDRNRDVKRKVEINSKKRKNALS